MQSMDGLRLFEFPLEYLNLVLPNSIINETVSRLAQTCA